MNLITADSIVKDYNGYRALNQVSLEVPEGSIYGLLGPNGAGKTTLLRIINQITGADQGRVLFRGKPLSGDHRSLIGYLPEERGLYKKMKVGEQALYLSRLKGLSKQEATRRLKHWFDKFEIGTWWHKRVEELSKGMAQKVQFITTVLHEPELLIFDEPFSGFDPINTKLLKQEILNLRDRGATIIFSTHDMASVEELCMHITLLNEAETVLQGEISQIRERFKVNRFQVNFTGDPDGIEGNLKKGFRLSELHEEEGESRAIIEVPDGTGANELLLNLTGFIQVKGFQEILPGMNDIFIQVVKGSNNKPGA